MSIYVILIETPTHNTHHTSHTKLYIGTSSHIDTFVKFCNHEHRHLIVVVVVVDDDNHDECNDGKRGISDTCNAVGNSVLK
jgi:predicted ATP-dependent endonuclease of OLD family